MNSGPATTPQQPIAMHQGITAKAEVTPDFNWSTSPVGRFTIKLVTGTGTGGNMNPGMPNTGSTDTTPIWLLVLGAGTMLVSGLAVRRAKFVKR